MESASPHAISESAMLDFIAMGPTMLLRGSVPEIQPEITSAPDMMVKSPAAKAARRARGNARILVSLTFLGDLSMEVNRCGSGG